MSSSSPFAAPSGTAADRAEIGELALLYARAMDSNEPELLDLILTEDIVIVSPGIPPIHGLAQNRKSPAILREMFRKTQHRVHNQLLHIDGDTAVGETYSTADHVLKSDDAVLRVLSWALRYQDRYRREAGRWRFSERVLVLDWSEVRPIKLEGADPS